jgi:hypothetical protein
MSSLRARESIIVFIVSLVLLPAIFFITLAVAGTDAAKQVTLVLFAATLLVEIFALYQAVKSLKLFAPSDVGYLTWTLIVAFLVVRVTAELRLATLNFDLAPKYSADSSTGVFFYVVVLRYLYTISDLLFVGALATTIRAYQKIGLIFSLLKRDYVYLMMVWMMPVVAYIFRENLLYSSLGDRHIGTFRLVTVTTCALIVSLCIVIHRYVSQMGGGAIARVWRTVAAAGAARALSFLSLALLSSLWLPGALFFEQYLLWGFACCWLIAAIYQQEVVPKLDKMPRVVVAKSEMAG